MLTITPSPLPHQRSHLSKTSKLLSDQRQKLKHYRDILRLKQADLDVRVDFAAKKIIERSEKDAPAKHSDLNVDDGEMDEWEERAREAKKQLEQAALFLYMRVYPLARHDTPSTPHSNNCSSSYTPLHR
jgi:hypothetical protein